MKAAIVLLVSKFQVFIEKVLDEWVEMIRKASVKYSDIPLYCRINSIRILLDDDGCRNKLKRKENYNRALFKEVCEYGIKLGKHIENVAVVSSDFYFHTKFPLGKTGSKELTLLLEQIEGKDIFDGEIDIGKLDSLLNIRHNIVHQDANPNNYRR